MNKNFHWLKFSRDVNFNSPVQIENKKILFMGALADDIRRHQKQIGRRK